MASITNRLIELSQFLGWEVKPLELLEWINNHLQYLPEDCRQDTEDYFKQEEFKGEYFRVNEGRAALYALYHQSVLDFDLLSDMQVAIEDYFAGYAHNHKKDILLRAFYLAEYLAQTAVGQDNIIEKCLDAATIGIEAKEWEATYKVAMRPFMWGYVPENEREKLEKFANCARKEMNHKKDYPEVD